MSNGSLPDRSPTGRSLRNRRRTAWITVGGIVAVCFTAWVFTDSQAFEDCVPSREQTKPYHALQEKSSILVQAIPWIQLRLVCSFVSANENTGAITGLAGIVVAFFTATLWWVTWGMVRIAEQQRDDSLRVIIAAEKSADAALAALNKPWIVVEDVEDTKLAWFSGKKELYAQFTLHNYGDAPAFITLMKGTLFQTIPVGNREAFRGVVFPADYKDMPLPKDLESFFMLAKQPDQWIDGNVTMTNGAVMPFGSWQTVIFDAPVVVTRHSASQKFRFRRIPIRPPDEMNIDVSSHLVLLGQICYHGPDEQPWAITFCYVAGAGGLQRIYGPPYNERKKGELSTQTPPI